MTIDRSFLLRISVAALLAVGAVALGQAADTDLRVPGANSVAADSRGFDALVTCGAHPPAADDERSSPSGPVVHAVAQKA